MRKRFEALDAFRGLCALSVVVFHMNLLGSITEFDFFRGSSIFVDFFFVLSGFVLAHGYGFRANLDFYTFMKSRFFRLYPLHFIMLFVFVLLECGKLVAYDFFGFSFNTEPFTNHFSVSEIIPNLLLIQSWTPYTDHLAFNSPSWSISIEFYIYAFFFITMSTLKRRKASAWFWISFIAFFLIYWNSTILVPAVLAGLSCFFGGAATYVIYKKLSHFKPSYALGSMVESFLLISIILIVKSAPWHRLLLAPSLFFITILFFSFESGFVSKILKIKPLQCAGKWSYSIYMTHAAVLYSLISVAIVIQKTTGLKTTFTFGDERYLDFGGALSNNLVLLLTLGLITYISSMTYKYVESYGQRLGNELN